MMLSTFSMWPEMALVRQSFSSGPATDMTADLGRMLEPVAAKYGNAAGQSVAVAVGSRKIDRLDEVVFHCLRFLEKIGFRPFIIPAMGSHGGATSEGQKQVLAGYKITEEAMKAPVVADMATRIVDDDGRGLPLFISRAALDADYIVPVNRIKPHTKFSSGIESGLCKMLTIGLGKADGAAAFHLAAVNRSFCIIEEAAIRLLEKLNILFGIGMIEDGYGRLAHMEAVFPEDWIDREKQLLAQAKKMMGAIPFDNVDILIIDQMGKDISGIGMDSNVTGRHRDIVGDFYIAPHVKRIFVRDLSEGSDGNANGIGLADVATCRLVDKIDREKTFVNAVTAVSPEKAAIPMHFETDRECLSACAQTTGVASEADLRIVRILNTARLQYIQASRPLESEIQADPRLSRIGDWQPLAFDASGNLTDFIPNERD
ncbi:MAG: DUF2088 domain-containing protein [Desulfobacterales bacterium]|nr:DUF2088 domain-containing protein [Desulfobacterales bacterium]